MTIRQKQADCNDREGQMWALNLKGGNVKWRQAETTQCHAWPARCKRRHHGMAQMARQYGG